MANDVLGDEIGSIDNGCKTEMHGEHGGQTGKRSNPVLGSLYFIGGYIQDVFIIQGSLTGW